MTLKLTEQMAGLWSEPPGATVTLRRMTSATIPYSRFWIRMRWWNPSIPTTTHHLHPICHQSRHCMIVAINVVLKWCWVYLSARCDLPNCYKNYWILLLLHELHTDITVIRDEKLEERESTWLHLDLVNVGIQNFIRLQLYLPWGLPSYIHTWILFHFLRIKFISCFIQFSSYNLVDYRYYCSIFCFIS